MSDYFRARVESLEATSEFPIFAQHETARRYAMKHDPRLAKLRPDQCLSEVIEALAGSSGPQAFRDLADAIAGPDWYLEEDAVHAIAEKLTSDSVPGPDEIRAAFDKDVEGFVWTILGALRLAYPDTPEVEAAELVLDLESVHPDGVLPGPRDSWSARQDFGMRLLRDFEAEHVHRFERPPIEETYGDRAYEDRVPFSSQLAFAVDVEPDDYDEGGRVWIFTAPKWVLEMEEGMSFHSRAHV